jgi:hypothetical protein
MENLESNTVTMTVSEIAQVLRIGRNTAYQFVRLAYEDTENYFQVVKIGQQYRAITSSFFDWLKAKR